jgi:hypothetical protein
MQDESRFPGWVWLTYVLLFGAAVPWYLPEWAAEPMWPGFPLWVTVSLASTFALAAFTIFVIGRYWGEPSVRGQSAARRSEPASGGERAGEERPRTEENSP